MRRVLPRLATALVLGSLLLVAPAGPAGAVPPPLRAVPVNGFYVPVAGDFNGDGADDIVWYGPGTLPDTSWYWTKNVTAGAYVSKALSVSGLYRPVVGDYDGDGRDDIWWYQAGTQRQNFWFGKATAGQWDKVPIEFLIGELRQTGLIPLAGNFDGELGDDIFLYGPGSKPDVLALFGTSDLAVSAYPIPGNFAPFTGDFDGDGFDDIYWYGPGSAGDRVFYGRANPLDPFTRVTVVNNGVYARPVVAQVNGLGDDIIWYQPGAGPDRFTSGRPDRSWSFSTLAPIGSNYFPVAVDVNGNLNDDETFWYQPGTAPDYLSFAITSLPT